MAVERNTKQEPYVHGRGKAVHKQDSAPSGNKEGFRLATESEQKLMEEIETLKREKKRVEKVLVLAIRWVCRIVPLVDEKNACEFLVHLARTTYEADKNDSAKGFVRALLELTTKLADADADMRGSAEDKKVGTYTKEDHLRDLDRVQKICDERLAYYERIKR